MIFRLYLSARLSRDLPRVTMGGKRKLEEYLPEAATSIKKQLTVGSQSEATPGDASPSTQQTKALPTEPKSLPQVIPTVNQGAESLSQDSKALGQTKATPPARPHSIVPPSDITAWTSAAIPEKIPPLPIVLDPALETAALTHSGAVPDAKNSYERLEWIGDAYLYLLSSLLISKTFPDLQPGKCSQIREKLVKNETLGAFACQYGFDIRARLPVGLQPYKTQKGINQKEFVLKGHIGQKVLGDIFEAYIAAIILSDPEHGVSTVTEWMKALWSMKIAAEIRENDKPDAAGQKWKIGLPDGTQMLPKDALAKRIGGKEVHLDYVFLGEKKDEETGRPLFSVGLLLTGYGERNKSLGQATAASKKEAGQKLAMKLLANNKLLKPYEDMKRLHDERVRKDRALADW